MIKQFQVGEKGYSEPHSAEMVESQLYGCRVCRICFALASAPWHRGEVPVFIVPLENKNWLIV